MAGRISVRDLKNRASELAVAGRRRQVGDIVAGMKGKRPWKRKDKTKKLATAQAPRVQAGDLALGLHAYYWDLERPDPAPPEPLDLSCLSRRERDEVLLFGAPYQPSILDEISGGDFDDERFFEEMIQPPGQAGVDHHRRKMEAERLMWELLSKDPAGLRGEAIQQPPYRDFQVAQALLDGSERSVTKFELPRQSLEQARVAEEIAKLLEPELHDFARVLRVQAHCLQGNAERLRGRWEEAEKQLRLAHSLLQRLVRSTPHAYFLQHLASLREDQGRLAEAAALLREAHSLFRERGDGRRAADCQIQLGFVYLQQDDPAKAMKVLTEAYERIPSLFVSLLAKVKLGQVICLAGAGLHAEARELREKSLPLRACLKPKERVRIEWLECRIAVHLGELETAIPRLEAVCRRYAYEEDLSRLCLSAIDLAYAYARAGKLEERFPALLQGVAKQPGAGEEPWALGALWSLREAIVGEGRDPAVAAREAAALVRRREKSPLGSSFSSFGEEECLIDGP
jgi:tetratricopeptide (TPR) repeat protein